MCACALGSQTFSTLQEAACCFFLQHVQVLSTKNTRTLVWWNNEKWFGQLQRGSFSPLHLKISSMPCLEVSGVLYNSTSF